MREFSVTAHPATEAGIAACAEKLKQGGLVALPTETVYGLAGDATNADAIAAIYATKARPQFNPLICHIADMDSARELGQFNDMAEKLAAAFWPGPLTLVVPRQKDCAIDPLASAGLDTIALRIPAHAVTQKLLRAVGLPLVAPSANPSGRLSPSSVAHVAAMLPDSGCLMAAIAPLVSNPALSAVLMRRRFGCAPVVWRAKILKPASVVPLANRRKKKTRRPVWPRGDWCAITPRKARCA